MALQWVIDTDGGIDDAQALVLALRSPTAFPVLGITLVAGNVPLPQVQTNIQEVLLLTNRCDLPVYKGASRPLVRPAIDATDYHGADGLGGYWSKVTPHDLPDVVSTINASEAIINLSKSCAEGMGLVTIGPLTNLAIALMMDPTLPQRLKRVVIMGAAETGNGNISIPSEFNIYWDPEAAFIVFDRLSNLEIVSWEATISPHNSVPHSVISDYISDKTDMSKFLHLCEGSSKSILCDVMAVAVAIRIDIVEEWETGWMTVVLDADRSRGRTLFSRLKPANVRLAKRLNLSLFSSMILHSVS